MKLPLDISLNGDAEADENSTKPYITATGYFEIIGERVLINNRQR